MNQTTMPVLFLGHGSPMNVLEDNLYTRAWAQLGETVPKPKAIVVISAHWYTQGTFVTSSDYPKTIHDFYGFPQALFDVQYPAKGSLELAQTIQSQLLPLPIQLDSDQWGLDHGSWGVLIKAYPKANIPVVQLSIDRTQSALYHYMLGQKLALLRMQGVLIIASGNVVHNLRAVKYENDSVPYDWAIRFNQFVAEHLEFTGDEINHPLINYIDHPDALLACPTPEHYLPLLYVLGAWDKQEAINIVVNGIEMGSLGMMSIQIG